MAPLEPKVDHDQARAYAKQIARRLAATAPDRYTLSSDPGQRPGGIFIDYLRNGRGTTAWCPVATRAGGISNCGPRELAPGRERDWAKCLYYEGPAAQIGGS